jgi:hypothetical protein
MFGTIRKHQTWLWAVIIAVIIVSFVFFFSPYAKMNDSRRNMDYGRINGQKVTEDQFANAWKETGLQFFFQHGAFPGDDAKKNGFRQEEQAYQWLLLLQKAEQAGIRVKPEEVAHVAQVMLAPFQRQGITSPDIFIKQVLQPRNMQVGDFERFVRHYLMVQELIGVAGLSGKLVTPEEAKGLYEREHQDMATQIVFFNASNHLASVTATPEAIQSFYTNRLAYYRLPDRVQVSYVSFPISNYFAQAEAELMKTNFNDMVNAAFARIGTNYTRLASTPDEAKAKIREEMIKEAATVRAYRAASTFATPLYDMDPAKASNLALVAGSNGLRVQVSAPFDRETGPQNLEVGLDFVQKAFSRNETDPFAGPIRGQNAVYVIALDKRLPSEIPPLDQIRTRVTEDFKTYQAITQARTEGAAFYSTLTNEMAKGRTFAAVCLGAKLKPISLPPFSLSTQDVPEVDGRVSMNQLKQMAFSTPVGKASVFQPTPEGGFILYVNSKLPMDIARMNEELPAFIGRVRANRENDAFQQWLRSESQKGLRDVPMLQQAPPPPSLGSGSGAAAPKKS